MAQAMGQYLHVCWAQPTVTTHTLILLQKPGKKHQFKLILP